MAVYDDMNGSGEKIGVIGGLITLAFSYMLSWSFPCFSGGRDVLPCL